MKKVWKAGISGLAALSLGVAGFGAVAGAAHAAQVKGPFTITVDGNEKNHTINAYQIFKGDLDLTDGKYTLSNIEWGNGITEAGQNALYEEYNLTGDDQNAIKVAEEIAADNMDALEAQELAKLIGQYLATVSSTGTTSISVNDPGYYLLKDTANLTGANDANSAFMMEVVKDVTVKMKVTQPTVSKKVQDETTDAATDADANGWGSSADHAIGESFDFKVTATLPADSDRAYYDAYEVKFTDTMSAGVTYEELKTLTIAGTTVTLPADGITVTEPSEGSNVLIIDIEDVNDFLPEGTKITDAISIVATYAAHLNEDAKVSGKNDLETTNQNAVYLEYSNNPTASGLGKTSTINTYVFTWEVPMLKVDADATDKTLADAKFTLKDASNKEIAFVDNGDGTFRVATADDVTTTTTITSNAAGKFDVKGLDAGTYTLTETEAPSGYNLGGPWEIVIGATHGTTNTASKLDITLDGEAATTVTILNKKGSQLPSTGGMGTTILYTVGGAIVLMAGIGLAVALRRRQA